MGREAQARGCVLGGHALLDAQAQAFEECVLGSGAQAAARAQLLPGVKIWPYKTAYEGERLESNRVWGSRAEQGFSGDALPLSDPAQAARAAQALAALSTARRIFAGTHALGSVAGTVPRLRGRADVAGRAGARRGRMHPSPASLRAQGFWRGWRGACRQRFALTPDRRRRAHRPEETACGQRHAAATGFFRPLCRHHPAHAVRRAHRAWLCGRAGPRLSRPGGNAPPWRCLPRTHTCSIWRKRLFNAPGCACAANGKKK